MPTGWGALLLLAATSDSLLPLPEVMRAIRTTFAPVYERQKEDRWHALALQYGLERDSVARRRWAIAGLLYELLRPGGWLGVRYVPLERRAELERLYPDDSLLWRSRPLSGVLRSDHPWPASEDRMERVPRVFLEDLLAPAPRYRWGDTLLYGFGWCSELEMAYVALLRMANVPARIVMPEPSHVQTAVALSPDLWLVVDQTRGSFMRSRWPYASRYAPRVPTANRFYADWYQWRAQDSLSLLVPTLAWERIRDILADRLRAPLRAEASEASSLLQEPAGLQTLLVGGLLSTLGLLFILSRLLRQSRLNGHTKPPEETEPTSRPAHSEMGRGWCAHHIAYEERGPEPERTQHLRRFGPHPVWIWPLYEAESLWQAPQAN
ncbi:MAG: hypothetical protein N2561_05985 [Bacteroidetes bacterium]|nr:hypothetical protein [Rhodothermia bacterium]MCS7154774.1 hypothetical protein [Bacteroidota bacterium]MCX7907069.1 hypothetical protein [Bacteroidota bacterium]MDW8137567.1 hypothetical protein [Bacteroidota bacterium]MDW8285479.1 hypothetical protein [Bacteroidota bacterium]